MSTSQRPPSYASITDPFIGQRFIAAIVDICFFAVITVFGLRKIIGETLIATLLSSYAAFRFGIAHGKQQAVTAMSVGGAFGGGGGMGGGTGGGAANASVPVVVPIDTQSQSHHRDGTDVVSDAVVDAVSDTTPDSDRVEMDPWPSHQRDMMLGLTRR